MIEIGFKTYCWIAFAIFLFYVQILLGNLAPIPETSGNVFKVANAAEFDALLASTKHVVVDFYADWCPPCRAIAPTFSELADKHSAAGQLAFAKINVDHVDSVALKYGVTSMPTFLFFQNGKPTPVAVEGLVPRPSVVLTTDGKLEGVRGADRGALIAVAEVLAGQQGKVSKE